MICKKIILFVLYCVYSVQCQLNLPEGSACTVKGINGTCVTLFKCYSAALDYIYTKSGYNLGPGMPEELCSYTEDNQPVYCCTDCTLDTNQTLRSYVVVPDGYAVQNNYTSIAWDKCIEYFQTLPFKCRGEAPSDVWRFSKSYNKTGNCHDIRRMSMSPSKGVGGRDANRGEFPHMALLGFGADQESVQWLCGGSVISERFILTAAHCYSIPRLGNLTYAALGILKRTDLTEFWKLYKIQRIIVHPQYKSPQKYHDIALLETETEINFGRTILPACLHSPVWKSGFDTGEAPGWGRLGHRKPLADVLQVLELREFDSTACGAVFQEHRLLKQGYNHSTQMCFGARIKSAITDTCEGDSGGPLQKTYSCMFIIFGVTSFGKDCGLLGSAGMYTRVQHYLPWIESVVWPELYKNYYK